MLNRIHILLLGLLIAGCNPVDDVQLELPEFEQKIVVEGYLEDGQSAYIRLTESFPFWDYNSELPIISGALVTLSHHGLIDTLNESYPGQYRGLRILNREDGGSYLLTVETPDGRIATSETEFLPVIPLDSLAYNRDSSKKARILMYWQDPPEPNNYYRISAVDVDKEKTWSIEINDGLFDGEAATWVSPSKFRKRVKVDVRLYHLTEAYYRFLTSIWNNELSATAPVTEPTSVVSNIEGGLGIFTSLNYSELSIKPQ